MIRFALPLMVLASPALAASGPFFSLRNTDFVVTLAFILFIAILFYYKVPALIGGLLDKRAAGIRADLDAARSLREDAQTLLASYERKHKEVQEQADNIVSSARREAEAAAEQARDDLKASIARRLASAEEQIASAESAAMREVRDRAISVAIAAAADLLSRQLDSAHKGKLIDDSISLVDARLH